MTRLSLSIVAALALADCGPSTAAVPPAQAVARVQAPGPSPKAAALLRALGAAHPGDTIFLNPGVYSGVLIHNFTGQVTITSRDKAHPATFTDLTVKASGGLTFSDLEFSTIGAAIGPLPPQSTLPFQVGGSHDIHFLRDNFHGAPDGTLANTVSGLLIRGSSNVSVEDSEFSHLHNAVGQAENDHLTFARDSFHDLFDDGIRGGGSSFVTVDGNHCYSNHPDISDPDHPDCIQFWTTSATTSDHDITITNNHYERGTGGPVQFIYMGNGLKIPYLNVKISRNVSYGAQFNGIAIGYGKGIEISDNKLISNCSPTLFAIGRAPMVIVSRIVTGHVDGLVIRNNQSWKIVSVGGDTNVVDSHNTEIVCN